MRNIKTAYWYKGKCVQINSSTNVDRAVGQAITHMRRNSYRAHYVEVYDADEADLLHCQVKRNPATGDISIYERSRNKLHANKYAATPLLRR